MSKVKTMSQPTRISKNKACTLHHKPPNQKLIDTASHLAALHPASVLVALHQANAVFTHVNSRIQAQARSDRCDHFGAVGGTAAVQPLQKSRCIVCQNKVLLTWHTRNQLHTSNLQRHATHNVLSLDLIFVRDKNAPKFLDVVVDPAALFFFLLFLGTSGTSSKTKTNGFTLAQSSSCFLWWLSSTLTLVHETNPQLTPGKANMSSCQMCLMYICIDSGMVLPNSLVSPYRIT